MKTPAKKSVKKNSQKMSGQSSKGRSAAKAASSSSNKKKKKKTPGRGLSKKSQSKNANSSSSSASSTRTGASSPSSLSTPRAPISSMSLNSNLPGESSAFMSLIAGGAYGHAVSAFTETAYHGQLVCCACGHVVKILSIVTGQVLHTLRGHSQVVTGLVVSPSHALRLYSCSLDGTVIVWDISNGSIKDQHDINNMPLLGISLPNEPNTSARGKDSDGDLLYLVARTTSAGPESAVTKAYCYSLSQRQVLKSVLKGVLRVGMSVAFRQISRATGLLSDGNSNASGDANNGDGKSAVVGLEPGVTVVAGTTKKTLKIWNSSTRKSRKWTHSRKLTVVALHPTAPHAVTGDVDGKILLWYNVARPQSKISTTENHANGDSIQKVARHETTTTSLHWHAHRVSALAFTPDGHYLLSGGEEAVLVIWQLRTLKQTFLPRLGATIVSISVSPNGETYVVGTEDNAIRVVDAATLRTNWSIRGVASAAPLSGLGILAGNRGRGAGGDSFRKSKHTATGMAVDPRTRCLMLNSSLGSGRLQLYDYRRDRHMNFVDVAPKNIVSRQDHKKMAATVVERIAFSPDGREMVTVDRRTDGHHGFDDVCTLKFWRYVDTELRDSGPQKYSSLRKKYRGRFELNTQVRTPHAGFISALAFAVSSHHGNMVVTASHDKKFKIWRPSLLQSGPISTRRDELASSKMSSDKRGNSVSTLSSTRSVWDCVSVGFYRDLAIRDASFSADASLLAVAYHNIVTLWSPTDNMLLHTLPHPYEETRTSTAAKTSSGSPANVGKGVQTVQFVGGVTCPLLAVATARDIIVWDLLTLSVKWTVRNINPKVLSCTGRLGHRPLGTATSRELESAKLSTSRDMLAVVAAPSPLESRVLLFDATSPVPVQTWLIPSGVKPTGLWFEKSSELGSSRMVTDLNVDESRQDGHVRRPNLLLATSKVLLYQLTPSNITSSDLLESRLSRENAENTQNRATIGNKSQFQKWFGVRQKSSEGHHSYRSRMAPASVAQDASRTLLDGPCHIVPSMSSLFDSFLSQSGGGREGGADADVIAQYKQAHQKIRDTYHSRSVTQKRKRYPSMTSSLITANDAMNSTFATEKQRSSAAQDASVEEKLTIRLSDEAEKNMLEWFQAEILNENQAVQSDPEQDNEDGTDVDEDDRDKRKTKTKTKTKTRGSSREVTRKASTLSASVRKTASKSSTRRASKRLKKK